MHILYLVGKPLCWLGTCWLTGDIPPETRLALSDSPASSGLNKGNHFRLEFPPISQDALFLLVSGKMGAKLILLFLISKGLFPSKYRICNEIIPAKNIQIFGLTSEWGSKWSSVKAFAL